MSKGDSSTAIVINNSGAFYKVATLFWKQSDCSLYLKLHRKMTVPSGHLGVFTAQNGLWSIQIPEVADGYDIDHSATKASGWSAVKTKDRKYFSGEMGVPLENLTILRPLWTLVPALTEGNKLLNGAPRERDLIIEEPAGIEGRALYAIAFPPGDIDFQPDFEVRMNVPPPHVSVHILRFTQFSLMILAHSEYDWKNPKMSIRVPSLKNTLPFLVTLSEDKLGGSIKNVGKHF
jgi:hypothetical protein